MAAESDDSSQRHPEADSSVEEDAAATASELLKLKRLMYAYATSKDELREAIQHAVYDEGISWQSVEDALGLSRGVAYARFRRKPDETP